MNRSPLSLHLPDADEMKPNEIAAVLDLKPASLLAMCYAQWDSDQKNGRPGVSEQTSKLVRELGHSDLFVRFHADPHPPGYAKAHGGAAAWGRLCAQRMTQYYDRLGMGGTRLHAILANETDADYEGGLSVAEASSFYRQALDEYAAKRPEDVIHIPAPTGAPSTHREHLERFKADGWVRDEYWVDGHGYNGDLENVLDVLADVFPNNRRAITETNNLDDFGWPIELLRRGKVEMICYFILNWARGGIGRVQPPSADDAAKQMSLMRFPARYQQFKATIAPTPEPMPGPAPDPVPPPAVNPWLHWSAKSIASVTDCPDDAVREHWPRLVAQLEACGINDKATQIAMIGTVAIESASTFAPVREAFWLDEEWRRANLRYYPWYGRGFIQLTWESNYRAYSTLINELWQAGLSINLIARPDDALDPDVSAAVSALYFRDHGREDGEGIPEAARRGDWREVRRLVQGGDAGLDRLIKIATALSEDAPVVVARFYGQGVPEFVVRQQDSWSCAVRATYAALWAMAEQGHGERVTYTNVYDWLVPRWDDPNVGLHDGTGAELAAVLRDHGYAATNAYPVTLDEVRAHAGARPVLIGGAGWYHWAYVRGIDADGSLILENPAGTHMGVSDRILDSWDRLGPFAAIWIEPQSAPQPAPEDRMEKLINAVGYLTGDVATRLSKNVTRSDPPALPKPASKMLKADWKARAVALEGLVMQHLDEDINITVELRRVGSETL